MIRRLLGYLCVTLLSAMCTSAYIMYVGLIHPMPLSGKEMLYDYEKGTSLKVLSQDLAHKGLIPSAFAFRWYARINGSATHLHAGEYLITAGMTPEDLIVKIRKGDIYMHTLRMPEGGTLHEVVELLVAEPAVKHTLSFVGDWFVSISPEYHLGEGLLLPETYFFPKGESDVAILKRAFRDEMAFAQKAFDERDTSVPYKNVYEALIAASILEKEASIPEERAKISRVIINRLAKGMPLQMDPTVIYGMGPTFQGNITKNDLITPGPYNTYLNMGLPPTPICLPSKNAVLAALHPAEGDYLYFVSRGDGSHYFSTNLKEHNNAVIKYVIRAKKDAKQ
ncbi:MAG: endolytic transglycosylase MltG [Gammaproteobacteria bacterium]